MAICSVPAATRRKLFWATQPDACGISDICGFECGSSGLSPITLPEGRTISTQEWIRGLVINMLMTDGRKQDTECGYRPGSQGGHWSESYIESGPATVGTLLRNVPTTGRILDGVNLITALAQATLDRLVARGVAHRVDVTSKYLGGSKMQLDISVFGRGTENAYVGINVARLVNGWVWN